MADRLLLTASVSGNDYNLTALSNYVLEAIMGIGLPEVQRFQDRAAAQHGVTDRGFVLEPRFIDLIMIGRANASAAYWSRRDEIRAIFKPGPDPIFFKFTLPGGAIRQIDLYYSQGLSMPFSRAGKVGFNVRDSAVLYAPNPTFYDPSQNIWNFGISAGSSGWDVPMPVPVDVGLSSVDTTKILYYMGDFDSYPRVELTGPATNPKIHNYSISSTLDFTGLTLASASKRIIDLTVGPNNQRVLTVEDENGVNKLGDLVDTSELGKFRIMAAQGALPPTVNQIGFEATGLTSVSDLRFYYFDRFIGL